MATNESEMFFQYHKEKKNFPSPNRHNNLLQLFREPRNEESLDIGGRKQTIANNKIIRNENLNKTATEAFESDGKLYFNLLSN